MFSVIKSSSCHLDHQSLHYSWKASLLRDRLRYRASADSMLEWKQSILPQHCRAPFVYECGCVGGAALTAALLSPNQLPWRRSSGSCRRATALRYGTPAPWKHWTSSVHTAAPTQCPRFAGPATVSLQRKQVPLVFKHIYLWHFSLTAHLLGHLHQNKDVYFKNLLWGL